MLPTLLHIGFVNISSLFFFITLAVIVAIFMIWKQAKEKLYPEHALFDTIILMLIFGIAAARVGYVLLHFTEFSFHILEWVAFWVMPGFYVFGALAGILLVLWYQSRQNRELKFWEMLDFVGFAFWIALIISFFGVFLAGSEQGIASSVSPATHPVTLYKLVLLLVFLSPYAAFRSGHQRDDWFHKTPGSVGLSISILLASIVVITDFFKVRVTYAGLSIDQWISFAVVIISFSLLYFRWKRTPKRDAQSLSRIMRSMTTHKKPRKRRERS